MKILVAGAGHMGSWFVESLCLDHEVAVYDKIPHKLKYFFHSRKLLHPKEIEAFAPELLINAVNLQHTRLAFDELIPYLPEGCILSDLASVKNGLRDYYAGTGFPYVSTHPMFGPTFANVKALRNQNAIIITGGSPEGERFYREFYQGLGLNIFYYSFDEHDRVIAYSLSIPFVSTMVFAACMKQQEVPGTTFRKHLDIAHGLLSEDRYLLSEILLNPYTLEQVEKIYRQLKEVMDMIGRKNTPGLHAFFDRLRENVGMENNRPEG
ncbi:MAG TPA: prephenate dehydrogenase [Bacteroidetes bacterium]|nr:prephenate dehydrogenase [Bacteroidota bacterium]